MRKATSAAIASESAAPPRQEARIQARIIGVRLQLSYENIDPAI
jgi:hypothetical protein